MDAIQSRLPTLVSGIRPTLKSSVCNRSWMQDDNDGLHANLIPRQIHVDRFPSTRWQAEGYSKSSQDTSPIPSSMSSPLSSLFTRVHQYKTRHLRIHSKSGQFLILQVNLQVIQVYKTECTRYDKVRIKDSRVKSEEQANPRLRVVHRVSYDKELSTS